MFLETAAELLLGSTSTRPPTTPAQQHRIRRQRRAIRVRSDVTSDAVVSPSSPASAPPHGSGNGFLEPGTPSRGEEPSRGRVVTAPPPDSAAGLDTLGSDG